MKFAVIETGGKQYRVEAGQNIRIEKLAGVKEGDTVTFDKVLLTETGTETNIGSPYVKGSAVEAIVKKISRYPTVTVIRYKAKSRYFKKNGHRQPFVEVEIKGIKY